MIKLPKDKGIRFLETTLFILRTRSYKEIIENKFSNLGSFSLSFYLDDQRIIRVGRRSGESCVELELWLMDEDSERRHKAREVVFSATTGFLLVPFSKTARLFREIAKEVKLISEHEAETLLDISECVDANRHIDPLLEEFKKLETQTSSG